jgi:thiamine transport system substrate-binding protein
MQNETPPSSRIVVLSLLMACAAAAGFGVYQFFDKFNRARNSEAPRIELIIYGSSSFVGPYGPGPDLAEAFKKICLCDIRLEDAGGSQLLQQKLKMPSTVVDAVVGLDQIQLKELARNLKWRGLKVPQRNWSPVFAQNHYGRFLPYDWSPLTFIFRKADVPEDHRTSAARFFKALGANSVLVQDPDLSTPGLQLVFWNELRPGLLQGLDRAQHRTWAPDWSAAYGLFKRGKAKATFTYLTSLVYHWDEEKDFSYDVAQFSEGHPVQIEFAGVPDNCRSCALGERFVEFLTEPANQTIIMKKNFMLPVIEGLVDGTSFSKLPKLVPIFDGAQKLDQFIDSKIEKVKAWKDRIKH